MRGRHAIMFLYLPILCIVICNKWSEDISCSSFLPSLIIHSFGPESHMKMGKRERRGCPRTQRSQECPEVDSLYPFFWRVMMPEGGARPYTMMKACCLFEGQILPWLPVSQSVSRTPSLAHLRLGKGHTESEGPRLLGPLFLPILITRKGFIWYMFF